MHTLFAPFAYIFAALKNCCSTLSLQLDQLANHPFGMFGIAAIVVTSLVLAVACATWAILERARRGSYHERVQAVLRRSQIARHFRDSILESLPEAVVVLRSRSQQALSYGGGSALLQQCLDGPDAAPLAIAINDLLKLASGFSLSVRTSAFLQVFVRGLRIGAGAALFLRAQEGYSANETIGSGKAKPVFLATGKPKTYVAAGAGNVRPIRASHQGEIIVGADRRLKQYNRAFATQISLSGDELRGEPLWADVTVRCIARDSRDSVRDIVACALAADDPERLNDWDKMKRNDGAPISLSVVRLKDGATRVTFAEDRPSETPASDTSAVAA